MERRSLQARLSEMNERAEFMNKRNQQLKAQLHELDAEDSLSEIEMRARLDLGFIKENEYFYWLVEGE